LRLVAFLAAVIRVRGLLQRDFVQTDILHGGPNDGQAAGFRREHIYLIGALSHIAEETFDRISALNIPMDGGRELVNEVGSQRVASTIDSEERFSKVVTL
jgi:hypothetical protein